MPAAGAACRMADAICAGRAWYRLFTAGLLATLAFSSIWAASYTHQHIRLDGRLATPTTRQAPDRTLVMYIFADTDPEFLNNLYYFVREAIRPDDNCDYIIVLQQMKDVQDHRLPVLPENAKYVHHKNECYDWGTFGWLLTSGLVNITPYRYFIFMNCSVRGPYFPTYLQGKIHWTVPLLSKITDTVKLVGPTISCEGSPLKGDPELEWRRNPHVQSFVAATDRVGLKVLLENGRVFQCHRDRWDAIFYSELGSSSAILTAGFNLDCLMIRYQGIDWRDQSTWECNARSSPANMGLQYDGISLDPLEVMFVKVKSYLLDAHAPFAMQAVKFQEWQEQASEKEREDVTSNAYVQMLPKVQAEMALLNEARGSGCFDVVFYREHNPDLMATTPDDVWQHFLRHGQFERRTHRFFCDVQYDELAEVLKKEANVTGF